MSKGKGNWRVNLIGMGLLFVAGLWVWGQIQDGVSAVWPWLWPLLLIAVVLAAVGVAVIWVRRRSPSGVISRQRARSAANSGMASFWQVARKGSRLRLWRKARQMRPQLLGKARWWKIVGSDWNQIGTRVIKVGQWRWLYSWLEWHRIIIGPSGMGKSAWLANQVVDAPGAVVTTSTKVDIIDLTRDLRAAIGPLYVFNPYAEGGTAYPTNIRFSVLVGCEDLTLATRRAGYLIGGSGGRGDVGDREFWNSQTVSALAKLFHAAALGKRSEKDVARWIAALEATADEVQDLLRLSPSPTIAHAYQQLVSTNDDTRTSITAGCTPALAWLDDPALAQIALGTKERPFSPEDQFDVARFVRARGTLYLISSEQKYGAISPLFAALVGEMVEQAKRIAASSPGRRLDPPLAIPLDEPANICRVPLDEWFSTLRSYGIHVDAAFQDRSQIYEKWGEGAGKQIWGQAGTIIITGGINNEDDLAAFSALCGEHPGNVGGIPRMLPVLPAASIRNLDEFEALVFQRYLLPVVGRIVPIWQRRDLKSASKKARKKADKVAAVEQELAAAVDAAVPPELRLPTQGTAGRPEGEHVRGTL